MEGSQLWVNGNLSEKDFITQTLKNTYWLCDELEKVLKIKVWITPLLVFTNAFVPFGCQVKGIRITNKKFLISMLQKPSSSQVDLDRVWEAQTSIADHLTTVGDY